MNLVEIGQKIRTARVARKLTQAQLADRAGISRTTFSRLERGTLPEIGFLKLQSVLAALDLALRTEPLNKSAAPARPSLEQLVQERRNSLPHPAKARARIQEFKHWLQARSDLSEKRVREIMAAIKEDRSIPESPRLKNAQHVSGEAVSTRLTLDDLLEQRASDRMKRIRPAGTPAHGKK